MVFPNTAEEESGISQTPESISHKSGLLFVFPILVKVLDRHINSRKQGMRLFVFFNFS